MEFIRSDSGIENRDLFYLPKILVYVEGYSDILYCLRFFRPLPKGRLCYNTILLKGVSNGETKNLHP